MVRFNRGIAAKTVEREQGRNATTTTGKCTHTLWEVALQLVCTEDGMLERQHIDAVYHNIIFDKPSKYSHLSGIFIVTKYLRQLT